MTSEIVNIKRAEQKVALRMQFGFDLLNLSPLSNFVPPLVVLLI